MTTISAIKAAAYELAAKELKERRNEIIEECARVVDDHAQSSLWAHAPQAAEAARQIAAAIRALKDKL